MTPIYFYIHKKQGKLSRNYAMNKDNLKIAVDSPTDTIKPPHPKKPPSLCPILTLSSMNNLT